MSVVVYTAVVGNYDYRGPHRFEDGVDYVFFTDGSSRPVQDRWKVVDLPDLAHLHPRRAAKIPKLFPHYFDVLKGYRHAVWIDGDMQIVSTCFTAELLAYLERGILLSPHFDARDCGYGEATIRPPKYAREPLDQQVAYYHREGFPEHFGLYEGGVIARRMDDPEVRELGQFWLLQNFIFSYQDQVSLPYSLWKTGVVPSVLPRSFRDYGWLVINAHRSED
jgi:hypothetical protein